MTFADPKSRSQIARFKLHEIPAARLRNRYSVAHWNDECRDLWQLERLTAAVRVESQPDTFVRSVVDEMPIG